MISIIISSANSTFLTNVIKNIEDTISVPFEIIAFDNKAGQKGICEIYNQGILQAKYEILCFLHEDIEIKTQNWGPTLIALFNNDPQLGLIGIAGSSYKPLAPSIWGGAGLPDTLYYNIIQAYKFESKPSKHFYRNPLNKKISTVACVDGVFLCTTKKIANEIKFDDTTFKNFHAYDIDFSLSVGQKYKVAVSFELLLTHFSEGSYDKTWMNENLKVYDKWCNNLPVNIAGIKSKQIINGEKQTFKDFIDQLIKLQFPMIVAFKVLRKNNRFFQLSPKLFFKLQFYIIKKYLFKRLHGN